MVFPPSDEQQSQQQADLAIPRQSENEMPCAAECLEIGDQVSAESCASALIRSQLKAFSSEELKKAVQKTSASISQKLLIRGITPSYELLQIEGEMHLPTFRYRASLDRKDESFSAVGSGRSKKDAKLSAARALIEKLYGLDSGADVPDESVLNPIGCLQEMSVSLRLESPTYELKTEAGLPHERLFTFECTFLNYREVGQGSNKKLAKRLAAQKMWTRLQRDPLDCDQKVDNESSEIKGDNQNSAELEVYDLTDLLERVHNKVVSIIDNKQHVVL